MSAVIAAAIMGIGLLSQDEQRLVQVLRAPLWLVFAVLASEVLAVVLILGLVLRRVRGTHGALLIFLFSMVPAAVGGAPVAYVVLQTGLTPFTKIMFQPPVHMLCVVWFATGLVALVRALRPA